MKPENIILLKMCDSILLTLCDIVNPVKKLLPYPLRYELVDCSGAAPVSEQQESAIKTSS